MRKSIALERMHKDTPPPCYGCTKRECGCHANCAEYAAYKERLQCATDEINEKENGNQESYMYYKQSRSRWIIRKREKEHYK